MSCLRIGRFDLWRFWLQGFCLERLNKGQSADCGVTKGGIDAADDILGLLVCLRAAPTGDGQLQGAVACLALVEFQLNRLAPAGDVTGDLLPLRNQPRENKASRPRTWLDHRINEL